LAGSPNFVRQVYNASSGAAPASTWKGNLFIQNLYTQYWDSHNLTYSMIEFDGRSDYEGFIEVRVCSLPTF
jgi:aminopeptidase Y